MLQVLAFVAAVGTCPLASLGGVARNVVRVVLVRHGQAVSNLEPVPNLPAEQLDHLTDLGRLQAAAAGAVIRCVPVAAIYCSTARRAMETADQIAEQLAGIEVTTESRVRALELGRKPSGEPLDRAARIAEWKAGRDDVPPGGESLAKVGERVLDFVESLRSRRPGQTVVVVSHSETIRSFLGQIRGVPGAQRYPPNIDNGSLTVVDIGPQGIDVRLENWDAQASPPHAPADAASAPLVWDVAPAARNGLPRSFRTTADPLPPSGGPAPDLTGLRELRASGSGQFTAAGLALLRERLRGAVTVVDLRQESHVFVDGVPLSWYATHNWSNAGLSHAKVEADELARLALFRPGEQVVIADDRSMKDPAQAGPPERLSVREATTERTLVERSGLGYVRIHVSDHARPLDDEVERFVEAVRALPPQGWAHFHCRAGRGRTTTFLVLYDMLRNANRVSLEDIAKRQEQLAEDYDVLKPAPADSWKAPYVADRIAFVRAFFEYARANPDGRPASWLEWQRSRGGRAHIPASAE
jgi:broad specificity phosphatase PhoE